LKDFGFGPKSVLKSDLRKSQTVISFFVTTDPFLPLANPICMRVFTTLLLILLMTQPIDLEPVVMPIVKPVNQFCLDHAPISEYRVWYQAIVCGQNLPPSIEKGWFQQTGLIHVIVVSGSHLIFLEEGLSLVIRGNRWVATSLRWALLLLFALASNLQPPITRALVHRAWAFTINRRGQHLKGLHLQLLSGLTTLAFFPGWWSSLSFLLSWLCALALSFPLPSKNPLWRAFLVYVLLVPALLAVQTPQPASILFNALFAPLLGAALFPLSLLGFFHPWFALLSDWSWRSLFLLFSIMPMPEAAGGILFSGAWLFAYVVIAQSGALLFYIRLKRHLWNVC
jgi:hypothetical protein